MSIVAIVCLFLFSASIIRCSNGDPVGPLPDPTGSAEVTLTVETLTTGLDTPWDLAWGPDNMIWVTERGGIVSRIDPSTGVVTQAGMLPVVEQSESGLMGMAFSPDFEAEPYVYLAYSHRPVGSIRNRLVRMHWDGVALSGEEVLVDDIPGASNHDGSRLAVGPDRLLYMTMGDATVQSLAQDRASLAGKVLRLTLDGEAAPNNPFGTLIYSYGHRNPQGLVFHPVSGDLYATEHGSSTDDEVNRIVRGGNYGWPAVHGFCDGNVSGESAFCFVNTVNEPLSVWTPTVAPSGADFYNSDRIPGWRGNLLFTTLRGASLYRLVLSADGGSVIDTQRLYKDQFGRLRDVLVGPRGEIYLGTSNRDGRGSPSPEDDRILRITPD